RAGEEREEFRRDLAFLHLAHRRPPGAKAGKETERPVTTEREPDRMVARCPGTAIDLGKTGEGNEAAVLHPQPSPPMWGTHVADVGDTGIPALAFEESRWRGHAPSRHGKLPSALRPGPQDRGRIVRIDAGLRRKVARLVLDDVIQHAVEGAPYGVLAFRQGIEVAHDCPQRLPQLEQ